MNTIIAYFQNAIEECFDQTGCEPNATDLRYLIDSDEFRDMYNQEMGRPLPYGSDGLAQVLIDVLAYYK